MTVTDIHNDILYARDVDFRINNLWNKEERDDEENAELRELRRFRDTVHSQYGKDAWLRGISFLAEDYMPKYAADVADERFGEVTATPYWNTQSADQFQSDYYADGMLFTLDGTKYWTDGQR